MNYFSSLLFHKYVSYICYHKILTQHAKTRQASVPMQCRVIPSLEMLAKLSEVNSTVDCHCQGAAISEGS